MRCFAEAWPTCEMRSGLSTTMPFIMPRSGRRWPRRPRGRFGSEAVRGLFLPRSSCASSGIVDRGILTTRSARQPGHAPSRPTSDLDVRHGPIASWLMLAAVLPCTAAGGAWARTLPREPACGLCFFLAELSHVGELLAVGSRSSGDPSKEAVWRALFYVFPQFFVELFPRGCPVDRLVPFVPDRSVELLSLLPHGNALGRGRKGLGSIRPRRRRSCGAAGPTLRVSADESPATRALRASSFELRCGRSAVPLRFLHRGVLRSSGR